MLDIYSTIASPSWSDIECWGKPQALFPNSSELLACCLTGNCSCDYKRELFENELPFYFQSGEEDPVLDSSTDELLVNGQTCFTYPIDHIIDFYSIKISSSNAKQLARMLQVLFGFEEIAFRGLETGSTLIASHVLKSGNIVIEIVNTLESVRESSHFSCKPQLSNVAIGTANSKNNLKLLINSFANSKLNISSDETDVLKDLVACIMKAPQVKRLVQEFQQLADKTINSIEPIYNDFVEAILIQNFLVKHSDGVLDISFLTNNLEKSFSRAVLGGAKVIRTPLVVSDDYGSVKIATIMVPNTDLLHTLIEKVDYIGSYLPNYRSDTFDYEEGNQFQEVAHNVHFPEIPLVCVDHCVENYMWNQSLPQAKFYASAFGFHKFWSVSESDVFTENSSLISIVMASGNGKVKIPINEPAKSRMRGQIEEFYDFNLGPGIQHIAFRTNDIIATVRGLRVRGVEFNLAKSSYYENLMKRMKDDDIILGEPIEEIMQLGILVDYDPRSRNKRTRKCNYILQIFTKPLHDRPTLFIEIIQRHHHNGFGKGTFQGLFETIEEQQILRGTLVPYDDDDEDNDDIEVLGVTNSI